MTFFYLAREKNAERPTPRCGACVTRRSRTKSRSLRLGLRKSATQGRDDIFYLAALHRGIKSEVIDDVAEEPASESGRYNCGLHIAEVGRSGAAPLLGTG